MPKINAMNTAACETRYHGPTDSRGSRVSAKHFNTLRKITLPWDGTLDSQPNHARAAAELLGSNDLLYCSIENGGYVWMVRR